MKIKISNFVNLVILIACALILKFYVAGFLGEENELWLRMTGVILIIIIGAFFVLKGIAEIIEETTAVLSHRTKIASGLLQSIGTAFPDMVLGIVSAVISLSLIKENYGLAINFAIIAASTTFGSNIYNIGHAAWCVFRQNVANQKQIPVAMLSGVKAMGTVTPMRDHKRKPSLGEIDASLDILNILTVLTSFVVISMVLFGQVETPPSNISGDLYQLLRPVGFVILFFCIFIMYYFRKTRRDNVATDEVIEEEKYFDKKSTLIILFYLVVSGIAILFAAESMVKAVEVFCSITGTPFVVAGVLAGIIGCIGEMIVVHNFTVNPKGRIGDALIGVAMDNIVTTMGAAIVAIMGGIFLGGNSLILIFVIILTLNTVLIWQISKLKNYFLKLN
jgi:hypothetical protein